MGGTKRKIAMEKIEKKDSRAVAFSKRRKGLYAKASELCLLSGSRIAILSTPVSSSSTASFYSFGHSSVDSVVSAFLENQPPQDDLGLGFWWEDKSLLESEDADELRDALNSMEMMMNKVNDSKKKPNQTLSLDSITSTTNLCIREDLPAGSEGFVKNSEEEEGILAICDKKKNDMDLYNDIRDIQELDQILPLSDKDIQELDRILPLSDKDIQDIQELDRILPLSDKDIQDIQELDRILPLSDKDIQELDRILPLSDKDIQELDRILPLSDKDIQYIQELDLYLLNDFETESKV